MTNAATEDLRICVDDNAVAAAIDKSVSWVRKDRIGARILPFYRIGGSCRYNLDRVRQALAALEEGGPASELRKRNAVQE